MLHLLCVFLSFWRSCVESFMCFFWPLFNQPGPGLILDPSIWFGMSTVVIISAKWCNVTVFSSASRAAVESVQMWNRCRCFAVPQIAVFVSSLWARWMMEVTMMGSFFAQWYLSAVYIVRLHNCLPPQSLRCSTCTADTFSITVCRRRRGVLSSASSRVLMGGNRSSLMCFSQCSAFKLPSTVQVNYSAF